MPLETLELPDIEQVKRLAYIHCTNDEIAYICGIKPRDFARLLIERSDYNRAVESGRSRGKMNMRKWQLQCAKKGNATMLVWLGKQYLGQSDRLAMQSSHEKTSRDRDIAAKAVENNPALLEDIFSARNGSKAKAA